MSDLYPVVTDIAFFRFVLRGGTGRGGWGPTGCHYDGPFSANFFALYDGPFSENFRATMETSERFVRYDTPCSSVRRQNALPEPCYTHRLPCM